MTDTEATIARLTESYIDLVRLDDIRARCEANGWPLPQRPLPAIPTLAAAALLAPSAGRRALPRLQRDGAPGSASPFLPASGAQLHRGAARLHHVVFCVPSCGARKGIVQVSVGGSISAASTDRAAGAAGATTLTPKPAYISEEVLENTETHAAYMNTMFWTAITVGVIGGMALVALFVLAWNDKAIPDALGSALQWALIILGVLLVGEALLGKVTVSRNE